MAVIQSSFRAWENLLTFFHSSGKPHRVSTVLQKNMAFYRCLLVIVTLITMAESFPKPDSTTLTLGMLLRKTVEKRRQGIWLFFILKKEEKLYFMLFTAKPVSFTQSLQLTIIKHSCQTDYMLMLLVNVIIFRDFNFATLKPRSSLSAG